MERSPGITLPCYPGGGHLAERRGAVAADGPPLTNTELGHCVTAQSAPSVPGLLLLQ